MSGYSQSEWDDTILDNRKWTNEVLILARQLRVEVSSSSFASHVERQLLAYYVAKNVLLDSEDKKQVRSFGEDMYLSHVKPPKPLAAIIVVSKDRICVDCEDFFDKVRKLIQVDVKLKCMET